MTSGGIKFSEVDFRRQSHGSVLGFALSSLTTSDFEQLVALERLYLAFEAASASNGNIETIEKAQVPKWFVQLQIARLTGNFFEVGKLRDRILRSAAGKAELAELLEIEKLADNPSRDTTVVAHISRHRRRLHKVIKK